MLKPVTLACLAVAAGMCAPVATAKAAKHEAPSSLKRTTMDWLTVRSKGVAMQQTDSTCGPASAATVLQQGYGVTAASEDALATAVGAAIGGTSFGELDLAVQEFGMSSAGFQVSLDQLRKVQTWAIVHLAYTKTKHFAVLTGMTDSMVELRDPSVGHYSLTWAAFGRLFLNEETQKGRVLLILPGSVSPLGARNLPEVSEKTPIAMPTALGTASTPAVPAARALPHFRSALAVPDPHLVPMPRPITG